MGSFLHVAIPHPNPPPAGEGEMSAPSLTPSPVGGGLGRGTATGGDLASFELRLSLLEEGLDALLHVLGLHQRQQLQENMVDVLVEGLVPAHAHHSLGSLD